jgi:hypothetical protein
MLLVLALCSVAGCMTRPTEQATWQPIDFVNVASVKQLEVAKGRIGMVGAHMTDQQVFAILGLENCFDRSLDYSGGSAHSFCRSYILRSERILRIVRDFTAPQEGVIRSVSLDDVIWRGDGNN